MTLITGSKNGSKNGRKYSREGDSKYPLVYRITKSSKNARNIVAEVVDRQNKVLAKGCVADVRAIVSDMNREWFTDVLGE